MTGPGQEFGLTLVIPVHDDAAGLIRVIGQAAEMQVFDAVLIVDDASGDPVTRSLLGPAAEALGPRLDILRLEQQGGAGRARNLGAARVTTSHVLFFDSDDWFLPDFTRLVAGIAGDDAAQAADFTLCRHSDSRMRARGTPGPLASDQAIWDRLVPPDAALPQVLARAHWPGMVRLSAYPWNKIYRTAFLRAHDIRCTEIPVHNDVELHWAGFMTAREVRVSTLLGCEHVVEVGGTRLTNRSGRDRFEVFKALDAVARRITAEPGRLDFLAGFLAFELDLFSWIGGTLDADLRPVFADQARRHLLGHDAALVRLAALSDPQTAARLVARVKAAA